MQRVTAETELSDAQGIIGTQCRTLSLGTVALCWAILIGEKHPTFLNDPSMLFQIRAIGVLAMVCLTLDFVHYSARLETSRMHLDFLKRNKLDDYPMEQGKWIRASLFYAKQVLLAVSSFWLVILFACSLFYPAKGFSQTPVVGTWSNLTSSGVREPDTRALILVIESVGVGGTILATENNFACSGYLQNEERHIHLDCEDGRAILTGSITNGSGGWSMDVCQFSQYSQSSEAFPPDCAGADNRFTILFKPDTTPR